MDMTWPDTISVMINTFAVSAEGNKPDISMIINIRRVLWIDFINVIDILSLL
jgi:hypothetical protein